MLSADVGPPETTAPVIVRFVAVPVPGLIEIEFVVTGASARLAIVCEVLPAEFPMRLTAALLSVRALEGSSRLVGVARPVKSRLRVPLTLTPPVKVSTAVPPKVKTPPPALVRPPVPLMTPFIEAEKPLGMLIVPPLRVPFVPSTKLKGLPAVATRVGTLAVRARTPPVSEMLAVPVEAATGSLNPWFVVKVPAIVRLALPAALAAGSMRMGVAVAALLYVNAARDATVRLDGTPLPEGAARSMAPDCVQVPASVNCPLRWMLRAPLLLTKPAAVRLAACPEVPVAPSWIDFPEATVTVDPAMKVTDCETSPFELPMFQPPVALDSLPVTVTVPAETVVSVV